MEKEFIPQEQTLQVKELGFDKPCFGYRDGMGCLMIQSIKHCVISTPTFSQVFRWFRNNYGLIGQPIPLSKKYLDKVSHYGWSIVSDKNSNEYENKNDGFDTYEEAELECLKYLIELCKKN